MYVPREEIPIWAGRVRGVMEHLPLKEKFGWDHQVDFEIEIEIGEKNMADLYEYDERVAA